MFNKRLLILTDAPAAPLYTPRVRYLIANLARQGWTCTVAFEQMPGSNFAFAEATNIAVPYYSGKRAADIPLWLNDKLANGKDRRLYRILTQQCSASDFDCILCSTFNTFPLSTAARLSRLWHLPLIADLRDIAEQWGDSSFTQHSRYTGIRIVDNLLTALYMKRDIRRRDKALQQAAAITTVSPWHREFMAKQFPHVSLIYNGYDEQTFAPKDEANNTFIISYTGRIYDFRLRNPQMLFDALAQMKQDGTLPERLELHFYCEQSIHNDLLDKSTSAGVTDMLHLHSFVRNDEVLNVLYRSSISLLLTNRASDNGSHGIMTTKFFEAMGVEKPVLCIPSDEECLAQIIAETNAGIAATTVDDVKTFILNKYAEWQHNGFTRQTVNPQQKILFSRKQQAAQFEHLITDLCQ